MHQLVRPLAYFPPVFSAIRSTVPGRLLLLAALAAAPALAAPDTAAPPGPAALAPAHVLVPGTGFFDDAMAFDAGARRLAAIRTDGTTFAKLEIFDVASGRTLSSWDIDATRNVEAIHLLPEGQGVLLVERQASTGQLTTFYLDATGKVGGGVGPATAFATAQLLNEGEKQTILIAMEKKGTSRDGRPGPITYSIAPFRTDKPAALAKPRTFRVDSDGAIKAAGLKMVSFFDGYTKILGERPGAYDRKKDVRLPPRQVVLDTITGKVAEEAEIGDVFGWALTTKLRGERANRTVFAQLDQDHTGVELVTASGKKVPLPLAVPFRLYDRETLQDQEGELSDPARYYFSMAIDPVNPDAVARRKADHAFLDLYSVDSAGGAGCALRARVPLSRPVSWKIEDHRLAVLKRFKSFTRGGDELELYDLR